MQGLAHIFKDQYKEKIKHFYNVLLLICPQKGKKKEKVPGFFYNLKQMNPFAKKQPKERDPEAAAAAPADDKEESKELLEKEEKGGEEKGDEGKDGEKKEGDDEKKAEGKPIPTNTGI